MSEMLRLWRSPYTKPPDVEGQVKLFADETLTAHLAYTDDVLASIADQGFNAIWMQGHLHKLAPSRVFPEFGRQWREHIRGLATLIERGARHGVKVYIYMQPAYGVDVKDPFWQNHPDVAGSSQDRRHMCGYPLVVRAICTSTQKVKDFLFESSRSLAHELPGLGGIIAITASEAPAHCYSKYAYTSYEIGGGPRPTVPLECPRCRERHPVDVVGEIIRLIRDGVRASSRETDILAWNWAWAMYEKRPSPTIIGNLPADVALLAGTERGDKAMILGKERSIEEYSITYPGPSPEFRQAHRVARKHSLRVIAKLQVGTSHELATVANLPLTGNLYDKVLAMRKLGLDGFMGCWKLGTMPSANTVAFNRFLSAARLPSKKRALTGFARDYFPGCEARLVVEAWETFASAMRNYPFSVSFLYMGPINYTLSYPVRPGQAGKKPAGRSWVDEKRGEWLEPSFWNFTLAEIIRGLGRLAREWKKGAGLLDLALENCDATVAREERDNAWACYHIFRSAWNTYRIFRLRKAWRDDHLPAYLRIIRNELPNLEAVLPIVERDKRLGWHPECQAYLFDAKRIRSKISSLKRQLKRLADG